MIVHITIETSNKAFADGKEPFEVARILEELAISIHENGELYETSIKDVNGNTVGRVERKKI